MHSDVCIVGTNLQLHSIVLSVFEEFMIAIFSLFTALELLQRKALYKYLLLLLLLSISFGSFRYDVMTPDRRST